MLQNECFYKLKTVIDGDLSYEMQTQFPDSRDVQNIQLSNYVGYTMGFTCFYEIQNNKALWAKWMFIEIQNGIRCGIIIWNAKSILRVEQWTGQPTF
jgi:hypothetical protein